ncbi:DUF3224 domain-containing protein [Streptomyces formicae]|uniref:DUF3224 domain-containing protein n=1 Tax=Streptomyces formicae TaxID=1616117 RepID=A0A291Q3P9_9ACTN|nr:DUF3224 domain-containing protein [Streptomyces formicae]ATL26094.1 hypothetical protein KY5_1076 [Streptomyces formicae]
MPTQITGTFTFAHWDEKPVAGADGGARIAHAAVTNDYAGGIEATGTSCEYTIAYTSETVGSFVGYEFIDGTLDGRTGSFVIEQRGAFRADGGIDCALTVLPDSATGELKGLTGTGSFTAQGGQPTSPYSLDYALEG